MCISLEERLTLLWVRTFRGSDIWKKKKFWSQNLKKKKLTLCLVIGPFKEAWFCPFETHWYPIGDLGFLGLFCFYFLFLSSLLKVADILPMCYSWTLVYSMGENSYNTWIEFTSTTFSLLKRWQLYYHKS